MSILLSVNFHFVQNYLFSMPKLKTMIGANRSLAKWLYLQSGSIQGLSIDPGDMKSDFMVLEEMEKELLGTRAPDSPLKMLGKGILAAAGGHFEFLTRQEDAVREKLLAALETITPGLEARITYRVVDDSGNFLEEDGKLREEIGKAKFESSFAPAIGYPFMQVCQLSGEEPAENEVGGRQIGRKAGHFIHLASESTTDALKYDPAAYVEQLVCKKRSDGNTTLGLPNDFSEFFLPGEGRKYIALIAMDGNDVGKKLKTFQEGLPKETTFVQGAVATEKYFYRLRLLNRIALTRALMDTGSLKPISVKDEETGVCRQVLPFRILMLGGDDVLLVMRAFDAMEFVQHFDAWWNDLLGLDPGRKAASAGRKDNLSGFSKELGAMTFKAGIALVPHNFPFHFAYDLVEKLTKKAKEAKDDEKGRNGVDWHILFSSLAESLEDLRDREYTSRYTVNGTPETVILTRRPYPISGETLSLAGAWEKAKRIDNLIHQPGEEKVARSKLKRLRTLSQIGLRETNLLVGEVCSEYPELKSILEKPAGAGGCFLSDLVDLIELTDLFEENRRSSEGE